MPGKRLFFLHRVTGIRPLDPSTPEDKDLLEPQPNEPSRYTSACFFTGSVAVKDDDLVFRVLVGP